MAGVIKLGVVSAGHVAENEAWEILLPSVSVAVIAGVIALSALLSGGDMHSLPSHLNWNMDSGLQPQFDLLLNRQCSFSILYLLP